MKSKRWIKRTSIW